MREAFLEAYEEDEIEGLLSVHTRAPELWIFEVSEVDDEGEQVNIMMANKESEASLDI